MPALEGQQPEYRIKHFSEERVAMESELSVALSYGASSPHISAARPVDGFVGLT